MQPCFFPENYVLGTDPCYVLILEISCLDPFYHVPRHMIYGSHICVLIHVRLDLDMKVPLSNSDILQKLVNIFL